MSDRPRQDPPPDEIRCERVKKNGERCRLAAVEGSRFCAYHGGGIRRSSAGAPKGTPKPPGSGKGGPPNNDHAMSYGAYTTKLPAHLESLRQMYLERYVRAVANPDPFDLDALDRAAVLQAKFIFAAADADCPAVTLDVIHRTLHKELRALRATREQREQTSSGTTPAEVVAAIMLKVAERRKEMRGQGRLEAPRPAAAMSAPARQGTVIDVDPEHAAQDIGDQAEEDLQEPAVETVEREEEGPAQDPDQDPELLEDEAAEEPADQVGSDDEWFPW